MIKGLATLPNETVIDGEIIAVDADGKPSFNVLQNQASGRPPCTLCSTSMLLAWGRIFAVRRWRRVATSFSGASCRSWANRCAMRVRSTRSLQDLIASVKAQGLEGLVAKRRDSLYEPGLRLGAWQKMRVNRGQEFVVGGYTVGSKGVDALILGYDDDGGRLVYAARTRNGFTPATRAQLMKKFKGLEDQYLPVREPAGGEERAVGRRPDGGENQGLPLVDANARGADRVPGVDRREPPAPHSVHRVARRSAIAGRATRVGTRLSRQNALQPDREVSPPQDFCLLVIARGAAVGGVDRRLSSDIPGVQRRFSHAVKARCDTCRSRERLLV